MMALEDEGREEGSQAGLSPLPGSLRPLLTHSCSFGKTESKDDRAVQLYKNCSCTFLLREELPQSGINILLVHSCKT